MVIPSDLVSRDNLSNAFGFIAHMIDALGEIARMLAAELVPAYGGTHLDGSTTQHDIDPQIALMA
jgi:hypothetical protein